MQPGMPEQAQAPQQEQPKADPQQLVSQAVESLQELMSQVGATQGVPEAAMRNLQTSIKSLEGFVSIMNQPVDQAAAPGPEQGMVSANQGAGEVIPG